MSDGLTKARRGKPNRRYNVRSLVEKCDESLTLAKPDRTALPRPAAPLMVGLDPTPLPSASTPPHPKELTLLPLPLLVASSTPRPPFSPLNQL